MGAKTKIYERIKEHKKLVIATGVTVATVVSVVFIAKNWDLIKDVIEDGMAGSDLHNKIADEVENIRSIGDVNNLSENMINVRQHIRNLHSNMHASPSKEALAAGMGIELGDHQTLVDAHRRRYAA